MKHDKVALFRANNASNFLIEELRKKIEAPSFIALEHDIPLGEFEEETSGSNSKLIALLTAHLKNSLQVITEMESRWIPNKVWRSAVMGEAKVRPKDVQDEMRFNSKWLNQSKSSTPAISMTSGEPILSNGHYIQIWIKKWHKYIGLYVALVLLGHVLPSMGLFLGPKISQKTLHIDL